MFPKFLDEQSIEFLLMYAKLDLEIEKIELLK